MHFLLRLPGLPLKNLTADPIGSTPWSGTGVTVGHRPVGAFRDGKAGGQPEAGRKPGGCSPRERRALSSFKAGDARPAQGRSAAPAFGAGNATNSAEGVWGTSASVPQGFRRGQ